MTYTPNQKPRKKRHKQVETASDNATSEMIVFVTTESCRAIHSTFINRTVVARRGCGQGEVPSLVCPKSSRGGFLSHECSNGYQTGATSAALPGPAPSGPIVYRQKKTMEREVIKHIS